MESTWYSAGFRTVFSNASLFGWFNSSADISTCFAYASYNSLSCGIHISDNANIYSLCGGVLRRRPIQNMSISFHFDTTEKVGCA
jgi:hypothetical protein